MVTDSSSVTRSAVSDPMTREPCPLRRQFRGLDLSDRLQTLGVAPCEVPIAVMVSGGRRVLPGEERWRGDRGSRSGMWTPESMTTLLYLVRLHFVLCFAVACRFHYACPQCV